MLKKLLTKYSNRFLSKWVVLLFDTAITLLAFVVAAVLRFNFEYGRMDAYTIEYQAIFTSLIYLIGYLLTQSYAGIIRHTSLNDANRIFRASLFAFFGLTIMSSIYTWTGHQSLFNISRSILIIHFFLTMFLLLGSRFAVKSIYHSALRQDNFRRLRVLIYGAGTSGMIVKNSLLQEATRNYEIIGFVDDNKNKVGKALEGIPVYKPDQVFSAAFIKRHRIRQIILAIQNIDPIKKRDIVERGLEMNLEVKVVPAYDQWINGELSAKQLRSIGISELLEREPIDLENKELSNQLAGKRVMVTGAAGSIGSEIVRQLLYYNPKKVILLDQAESPLYDLEFELKQGNLRKYVHKLEFVVGSIKDYLRMEMVFKRYQPQIVYHAAAYKHVPLMEINPYEAVLVNVFGTKIIADLSIENKVEQFVMVSTDKAVNPTNVMGATKRVAEIYTQALNTKKGSATRFTTTRFGNVLGSNGSVIPIFRKQIEKGGPITVTHPEITRYFMTIPEACHLVLEAGVMGKGGEIFVFDMGRSVKILDLAKKMIKLSGLELGKDIEIKITGLRPGEKLYEELLNTSENTLPTHHKEIMIAKVRDYSLQEIEDRLNELSERIVEEDEMRIVGQLKRIVPEFISQNSVFASLDKPA
jgi:FlaA1/EpsC-like NDP-sugar epimerase